MCPYWRLFSGETVGCTLKWASYMIGLDYILCFLWLVLNWEQEQKLGKLPFINQILLIWTNCYRSYCLAPGLSLEIAILAGWLPQLNIVDKGAGIQSRLCSLWVKIIFIYMTYALSAYIQALHVNKNLIKRKRLD